MLRLPHIDDGRDAGPFANTSHFFILAGLGGIVLSGTRPCCSAPAASARAPRSSCSRAGTRRSAAC
ncbi:MAG: hypothetical protein WKF33_05955 [Thermoleophilaceae bacterium]